MATQILEETSFTYTATLKDENGDPVGSGDIETLHLTVYNKSDKSILRTTSNALDQNGVSIDGDGVVTWSGKPYESRMANRGSSAGTKEEHVALFEYSWGSTSEGTLSNPFSATEDSSSVTVSHSSHGLAKNDHVIFIDSNDVGGLEMDGLYIIESVTDADTYVVSHRTAASSTEASAGGTVSFFANGSVGKFESTFEVVQSDPI